MQHDIFDDLPEYTLDDVDKKIDILDNLVRGLSDYIASSKEVLDDIDDEIRETKNEILSIEQKIKTLKNDIFIHESEIACLEAEAWELENLTDEEINVGDFMTLSSREAECEIDYLEEEIIHINKEIEDNKKLIKSKKGYIVKSIQSAANLLSSLNIQLNQIRHYQFL